MALLEHAVVVALASALHASAIAGDREAARGEARDVVRANALGHRPFARARVLDRQELEDIAVERAFAERVRGARGADLARESAVLAADQEAHLRARRVDVRED